MHTQIDQLFIQCNNLPFFFSLSINAFSVPPSISITYNQAPKNPIPIIPITPHSPKLIPSPTLALIPLASELLGATVVAVGLPLDQLTLDNEVKEVVVPNNKLGLIVPIVVPLLVIPDTGADVIVVLIAEFVFDTLILELDFITFELDVVFAPAAYVSKAAEFVAIETARNLEVASAPVTVVIAVLAEPGIISVARHAIDAEPESAHPRVIVVEPGKVIAN